MQWQAIAWSTLLDSLASREKEKAILCIFISICVSKGHTLWGKN